MNSVSLDPLRFVVEHRNPGTGGGPTLRVHEQGLAQRELLRFDCFERGPHWHVDPGGRDEISAIPAWVDPIDWTLTRLRSDLVSQLARAGFELGATWPPEPFDAALLRVERAMRNPPLDLDAIRPETRRPSLGEKWSTYPDEVLPLWVADMDFPVAEPIRRVLRAAVENSDLGYPIHPAPTDVAEITAARMQQRFGWRPDASHIEILTDVVQGIYVAIAQFSQPGDGVLLQTPIYAPFLHSVRDTKRNLIENPLRLEAQGYAIDVEGLRTAAARGARILLLCNPHNPSGRVFRAAELEAVAEIALQHDLLVVSDEIHADLVYSGHRHVPFASLSPEVGARTITLTAASKAFNVAGLRCAVGIFGSGSLKRQFCALPRHVRGGIGVLGIEALRAAWRHGQPWLDQVVAYLEANRDHLEAFVRDSLPGVSLHAPQATYLGWLDCRSLELGSDPYAFFLQHAKVALSDGARFGAPGRGFLRINFATSRNILSEALERMRKALVERC
jgi:cysteine-S-conjugate beta-lyase